MSQSSAWTRKKKEHIGNFKNAGQAWCREPESVLVHDYPQDAIGQAIPYGVYTLNTNQGYVCVGDCFDTPRFAVESIDNWWHEQGRKGFPNARRLLILADAGGSNSCRSRVWKAQLQEQICDMYRLDVTVCRYPIANTSICLTGPHTAPKLSLEALLDLVHWVERRGRHERLPGDGDRLACAASTAATAPDSLAEPADPAAVAGRAGHEGERE